MKLCLKCESIYDENKYKNCPVCKASKDEVKAVERVRKSLKDQNSNQLQQPEFGNLVVMSEIDLDD